MKKIKIVFSYIFISVSVIMIGCDSKIDSAGTEENETRQVQEAGEDEIDSQPKESANSEEEKEETVKGHKETVISADQEDEEDEVIPTDNEFVKVADYVTDIVVEQKYATTDNFTGEVIYNFTDAYLRYGTVQKLKGVQEELRNQGLRLKIWDAFRPVSAQFRLWEICPDPTYVANPNNGFSSHSRGNTVDITLVDSDGAEIQMPTGFDDFSLKADRDYSDCDSISANNAKMLENLMVAHGFIPYSGEWWHFSDSTDYEVDDTFQPPT